MAISRCRSDARARSMFTRFVHASSNTSTTTPIATAVKRKTVPRIAAPNRPGCVRTTIWPLSDCWYSRPSCAAIRLSALSACAQLTPSFSRPIVDTGLVRPLTGPPAQFKSWLHHHGEPEFRRGCQFCAAEFRWGDANDRIISPADEQIPADDLRIRAEPLLPAFVTQHDD
jgi:hypothetical protein